MSYTSYWLYQKYEVRGEQEAIPTYPNVYSKDADGTMPLCAKTENDPQCGYQPVIEPQYRWVDVQNDYVCDECENDYSRQYLTLRSNNAEGGIVKLKNAPSTFYYSTDSGTTWYSATTTSTIPLVSGGTWFKGSLTPSQGVGSFSASTQFTAEGNVMSLLYGDNFEGKTDLSGLNYTFSYFFSNCTGLTSAENLILPATTLAEGCYYRMFQNCTSLRTAPSVLLATTLADYCYDNMFRGCTSLTTAPELPATTLVDYCYSYMFYGCTSLNYIKCLATDISATNCTDSWVAYVPSSGTFVKAASMSSWRTSSNGIPSGWTVQNA